MNKWFHSRRSKPELNYKYLESFGKALVPLEFTSSLERFVRTKAPLSLFLKWIKQADRETSDRFYLAQASLEDLPKQLREDLPTPLIVSSSGRGDVYASNIWIGLSPTYTPLHRDPNPNLFVQLVGWKRVRLLNPDEGQQAFNNVQQLLKKNESGKFRGDEMMQGDEKELLDREIWDDEYTQGKSRAGFEAELRGGDALFIPQGWWHSIKGTGQGVTGSVIIARCHSNSGQLLA
ncbi:hypothetical protein MMC19_001051 [Ptychographa xylographoides]|nr:hypothetical protein [Ptychographa xylographoides]